MDPSPSINSHLETSKSSTRQASTQQLIRRVDKADSHAEPTNHFFISLHHDVGSTGRYIASPMPTAAKAFFIPPQKTFMGRNLRPLSRLSITTTPSYPRKRNCGLALLLKSGIEYEKLWMWKKKRVINK
ncbi:hypothetical protein BGW80DRAFT_1254783 [Lactifluus volemus]|nr:hypothetical protein BGW80DRAFT_1254783 [Lactifluus volemus]